MHKITLNEARAQGLRHYFTGVPCARGHLAVRFTSIRKCKECAREDAMKGFVPKTLRKKSITDTQSFVLRATAAHGGKYDYSGTVWVSAKAQVAIGCPDHGVFWQVADNHIQGKGCPLCRNRGTRDRSILSVTQFVAKAEALYGLRYDYTEVVYVASHTKVRITCKEHARAFWQTPTNHLSGKVGCTRCNHMKSAPEEAVSRLMSVFTHVIWRDDTTIKPLELDILMPERKLAIEYCGEYRHSSGDQESEVKMSTKHIAKHKAAAAQGIRLITIFDSEWQGRRYAIRRLLRTAVGKARGKVMARKCELVPVEHAAAEAFYERYHPQGGAGHGAHYGLVWRSKLVACMRFTEGVNDRGVNKYRDWTLSRYATRVTVQGGASRLFKAFLKDKNPKTVKSFSDNRYFSGDMYLQLGFGLQEDTAADYQVWHPKLGLRPKSHWQRREIPARAKQLGVEIEFDPDVDPRTERDMTYLLGGRRIYDCGKKKWVWTRERNP